MSASKKTKNRAQTTSAPQNPTDVILNLITRWVEEEKLSTRGYIIKPECGDRDVDGCPKYHLRDDARSRAVFAKMVKAVEDRFGVVGALPDLDVAEPCFYYETDPHDSSAFFMRAVLVESYEYRLLTPIAVGGSGL